MSVTSRGRRFFFGGVDVVVCDGFAGNLILKVGEGVADAIYHLGRTMVGDSLMGRMGALMMKPTLRKLKRKIDWDERGGAPLVGVRSPAFICHGASNEKAIKNALKSAARYAEYEVAAAIEKAVADHSTLLDAVRGTPSTDPASDEVSPRRETA